MALVLADRVQEYSTTTGTGTLTLSGAYAGFQTFAAGIGNGNTCYYTITSDTNQWEVGIGTVGVGTLARTTLISSSTGSLVSFVGTLTVFVTYPAEKSVNLDASNVMTGYAISGGTINGTTIGATTVAAGSFTTLNSSGDTRLGGLSGNQSLQVNNVASAVNYWQAVGAVTNGSPTMSAVGTDANIGLYVAPKGTAFLGLGGSTSGTAPLHVFANPSNVNYTEYNGGTSGGAPAIVTGGADANVALSFSTKGSSGFSFYTNGYGSQAVAFSHTASAVNYLNLTGAATGAAPTISAGGSDTNINLKLTPKGTGTVQFGTYTAGILAQAGYITITDAGGTSRRLLVG